MAERNVFQMMSNKANINQSIDLFDAILCSIEQLSLKHNYSIDKDNTYNMLVSDITEIDMEGTYRGLPCSSTILQLMLNRLNSYNSQRRQEVRYQIRKQGERA